MFLKISVLYADNTTLTTRHKNADAALAKKTNKPKKLAYSK